MANRGRQTRVTLNLNPRTLNPGAFSENPSCKLKLIGWDTEGTFFSGNACLEIRLIERHRKVARSANSGGIPLMQDRVGRRTPITFRKPLRDFLLNVPDMLSNLNLRPDIQEFVSGELSRYAAEMANKSMRNGFRRFHLLAVVEIVTVELIDRVSESNVDQQMEALISTLEEVTSQDTCPVCLEGLQGGGSKAVRTPCNHIFHLGCLAPWFQMNHTCPICRFEIQRRGL